MRNILHFGIERLENLPLKLQYKQEVNSKLQLVPRRDSYKYHNRKSDVLYRKARAIVRRSVGKDYDEVFSKINNLVKHQPFDINVRDLMSYVDRIHIDKDGKWWVITKYSGLTPFKKTSLYREDYYRHPFTNKITVVGAAPRNKEKKISYYLKGSEKKRLHQFEEYLKDIELKVMNDQMLHKYFVSLVKEHKECENDINRKPEPIPEIRYFKQPYSWIKNKQPVANPKDDLRQRLVSWRWQEKERVRKAEIAKIALIKVKENLDSLYRGDLNIFHSTNLYLYSLQKESHHF